MITPNEIIAKFKRNRNYYRNGGITSSGGEPLIHQEFCLELSKLCHDEKINLAFDTSGANFNKNNISYFQNLIKYKPLWIVDIKHINPKKHKAITGTANQNELQLIKFLEKHKQKY
jgi:pyruvate formate lyase activating enzyme